MPQNTLQLHTTQHLRMDSEEKKRFRFGEFSCMDSLRLAVLAVAIGLTLWRTCDCVTKYLQFRRESEVILKVTPSAEDSTFLLLPDPADGEQVNNHAGLHHLPQL